jgi:formyl-CoA transferase
MDFQAARWLIGHEVPEQAGNDHPSIFPTGTFETADGLVNIAATRNQQFKDFVTALGLPELADDQRFASPRGRSQNKEALRELCAPRLRSRTTAQWVKAMSEAGVPCGPIYRVDQVFDDPQVKHLGIASTVNSEAFGLLQVVRSPFALTRTPVTLRLAAPRTGEHSRGVLTDLGLTDEEISSLVAGGITAE